MTASMETIPCPACSELILPVAKKCKHCGEWIEKLSQQPALKTSRGTVSSTVGLIACQSCGKQIAQSADNCPNCGAKNSFEHPAVTSFKRRAQSGFEGVKSYTYITTQTSVKGLGNIPTIGATIGLLPLLGGLWSLWFAAFRLCGDCPVKSAWQYEAYLAGGADAFGFFGWIGVIGGGLMIGLSKKEVSFEARIENNRLDWKSNNDEYWKPIRDFFSKELRR